MTGSEREAAQARERAATIIAQKAGISPEQTNQWLDQLEAEVQQRTDRATTQAAEAADAAAGATASASIWGAEMSLKGHEAPWHPLQLME